MGLQRSTRWQDNAPPVGVKIQSHRVISRHHLVQFFCNPYEIFLPRHRCIYSSKDESIVSSRFLLETVKFSKNKCLDPLSRTLRTACSIQSRGVSCCGIPADQQDTWQLNIDPEVYMALNKYHKLCHFVCYVSLCILAALYHQLVGHQ